MTIGSLDNVGFARPGEVFDDGITDDSAVDNLETYVIDGHGGPNAVFDKDHYLARMRYQDKLIDFRADQGQVVGHPYGFAVLLIQHGDDNITTMLDWPPTDAVIKAFAQRSLQIFLENYQPRQVFLVALHLDIADPTNYDWGLDAPV